MTADDTDDDESFEGIYGQLFYGLQKMIKGDESIHRLQLLEEELEMFSGGIKEKITTIQQNMIHELSQEIGGIKK